MRRMIPIPIRLGDKVRDKISGFVGIVSSRTVFLNGCIQYGVQGKADKDNKMPDAMCIDEQSLEVIPQKKKKIKQRNSGGPNKLAFKLRGY